MRPLEIDVSAKDHKLDIKHVFSTGESILLYRIRCSCLTSFFPRRPCPVIVHIVKRMYIVELWTVGRAY